MIRRVLATLVLGLALAAPAWAAVAFVKASGSSKIAGSTFTITFASNLTAGNDLACSVAIRDGATESVSSITGIAPNVLSLSVQKATITNTVKIEVWTAHIDTGGGTQVSVTTNSTGKVAGSCGEYSGVVSFGATNTNSAATADPTINLTMADAANFAVAGFAHQRDTTATAKTGNLRDSRATAGGAAASNAGDALNDNTGATTVTNAVTWAAFAWAAAVVELQGTAPPAAPKTRRKPVVIE